MSYIFRTLDKIHTKIIFYYDEIFMLVFWLELFS